jgi:hypothetical protein
MGQDRWVVARVICGARAGRMRCSLVTGRVMAEGRTVRIWRRREWNESHPEVAPIRGPGRR